MTADAALLRDAVAEAGALALEHFHAGVKSWDKLPGDPVSEADVAVNNLLRARLMEARPGYGWLSEENADTADRLQKSLVWIVDPIDGTKAFIARKPEFCVSVALVRDGEPVLAAVFNPASEEYFFAEAGRGATMNEAPIRASAHRGVAGARFLGGKIAYEKHNWSRVAPGVEFAWRSSIAYRMALVAEGRFDATFGMRGASDWDIAAADLVVREAGGMVTDDEGRRLYYNRVKPRHESMVCAAPGVHAPLLALVGQAA